MMKDSKRALKEQNFHWLEIVLLLKKPEYLDVERINRWLKTGSKFTLITDYHVEISGTVEPIRQYMYDRTLGKSALWNRLISETKAEWVLFLEDDEDADLSVLESLDRSNTKIWMPAKIMESRNSQADKQFYQIRLLPALKKNIFKGRNLPEATAYVTNHNIELSNQSLLIYRNSELMGDFDIEEEMSVSTYLPQLYLYTGFKLLEERKTASAAAHFRALLKREKLISYDRLAAVNGLASCFTEQYKWEKGLALANESIEAEPLQFLPYLIKFRIFQLNKLWNEALDVLKMYHELLIEKGTSRANFEKFINLEETVIQLADLASKTGLRKESLIFYEELFSLKKEKKDSDLLNILLVLSIELLDYERSVFYFKEIFEEYLPDKLCEEKAKDLNDFLSMFMVNGWYDYPSEVYDMLHEQESENGEYRRRLIVTLSKTNCMERARKLIVQNV